MTVTPAQLAADEAALAASQATEHQLFDALVSAQNAALAAKLAEEALEQTVVADEDALRTAPVVPPVVVPPVVVPPVVTVTAYPKRTDSRGFVADPATVNQTPAGGVLTLSSQNATVSNTSFVGGINHTGGGVLNLTNVKVDGGHGWDGYIRSNGTIIADGITIVRGGTAGLGSTVSHGLFAGNGAHRITNFDISGAQTGISLGGGSSDATPCYVANGKVHDLHQIGSGHCESQFVSITGSGHFLTEFVHFEPGSRTGWMTAAAFMQPAGGECWWILRKSFLAGQNISLYIESAYKQTASQWTPAAPPAGHPGHLYASDLDFGPLTSPSAGWATYLKCGFGDFAQWDNVREVDGNYQPTGRMLPRLASYADSDSGGWGKPLTRVD